MENQVEVTEAQAEATTVEVSQFARLSGLKFNREAFEQLVEIVRSQDERIKALESKNQTSSTKREMTPEDAHAVVIGEHRELKHQAAADLLGLSYGQVYSARLGHTFKPVFKQMKDEGLENIWVKK